MKKKNIFVLAMLAAVVAVAIVVTMIYVNSNKETKKDSELSIVTSFYPMYVATANIVDGVDGVALQNLSEPQTGCLHDYQLTTADMKLLSTADIFVVNGGGIENFLTDIASDYPALSMVEASSNLTLLTEEDEENAHAWMSIAAYRNQVSTIAEQLAKLDTAHAEQYQENVKAYDAKLAKLQEEQEQIREYADGQNVILFHEAYAYVAEDYGLNVTYVLDLDEERAVSAGERADVLDSIENDRVSYILAEERYGAKTGDAVEAEANVKVIYLDACNRGDYDKDSYLNAMQSNIDLLREAFCK